MPNHIHCIVWISADEPVRTHADVGAHGRIGAHSRALQPSLQRAPRSLASFVAGFKSIVTKRINQRRGTPGVPVWQRNYYEHIVRDAAALDRIRRYIAENPLSWHLDRENPHRTGEDDV